MKSYKVELDPTNEQIMKINKSIGTCRFIYNFFIRHNKEQYDLGNGFISGYSFSKWLNNDFLPNNKEFSWIKETSSKAIKQSIMNCDGSFRKFFKKKSGFPKFKKKYSNVGVYLPKNSKTDFVVERHRIKIPTFGFIKVKEYGRIKSTHVIKSGTIKKEGDRYYISVLVDEDVKYKDNNFNEGIGIDLGIKELGVSSDSEIYCNINKTEKVKKIKKQLKRQQRKLSRKLTSNKKKGESSNNSRKQILIVQKLHIRLKRIRTEYVRFVVNSLVNKSPKFISIEDLNVSGMLRNRHLSRAISEQLFYYFRTFLISQCKKNNIEVRLINRWYPSSKLCSECGTINSELKLSDRVYKCDCGNIIDRDLNASINIKRCLDYKVI